MGRCTWLRPRGYNYSAHPFRKEWIMKLYGYQNENGKIKREEIEVEEKVVLVPKNGNSFLLIYGNQINREDVGKAIGCYLPTVYLKEPDFEHAKEILLEKAMKDLSEKENTSEAFLKSVEEFKNQMKDLENAVE